MILLRLYSPVLVLAIWALLTIWLGESVALEVLGLFATAIAVALHITANHKHHDHLRQRFGRHP